MAEDTDSDVLVRWSSISKYLGVSDKTAIRYAKDKDLPVQRDPAGHPWITKGAIVKWRANNALAAFIDIDF